MGTGIRELPEELPQQEKPVLMPLRNGVSVLEESKFLEAVQGTLIKNASIKELDELFRRIIIRVGIRARNLPSHIETAVLYEHLTGHYGGLTIQEIDLAFDMAITGKILVEVNAYENISCLYISNILSAYRIWAGQMVRQLKQDIQPDPRQTLHLPEVAHVPQWRQVIEEEYQLYLSGKQLYRTWPTEFYEQLVADNYIDPFAYKEFMDICRVKLCSELQMSIVMTRRSENYEMPYDGVADMEVKIKEYRNGNRDVEVTLFAKQRCVLFLFMMGRQQNVAHLYTYIM